MKRLYYKYLSAAFCIVAILLIHSCASISTPDGGPYDEEPPKVVRCTPNDKATNTSTKKVTIEFDEFIKLDGASEKVVISPPQAEPADIKANGKKIIVTLSDTLKTDYTYTIDFGDCIQDNNEGNPMGNYSYSFSTGASIDTMEVSGTVLDAMNLEPVKGALVGLYSNLSDTVFTTAPLERIARTNAKGQFVIKGIASNKQYKIYALNDADQNYFFNQKSEGIAFNDSIITPKSEPSTRTDSIWHKNDHSRLDSVVTVPCTRFMPNDIVLTLFTEKQTNQYLTKTERLTPNKFSLFFTAPADEPAAIEGLNFNTEDAFIKEFSATNDTLHFWIKDSLIYQKDTLDMVVKFMGTDTLGNLVPTTDTLHLASKKTMEKIRKEQSKKYEDWLKAQKKQHKGKDEPIDSIMPADPLEMKMSGGSKMGANENIHFSFGEPIVNINNSAFHLKIQKDTLWVDEPFEIEQDSANIRRYTLMAEWLPEHNYELTVDSAAFTGLYGNVTKEAKQKISISSLDEFSSLYVKVSGIDTCAIVQLLDKSDKVVTQAKLNKQSEADFYYIKPGVYYMRLFIDKNNNGVWDTGEYASRTQAETVFYYPKSLELKARWEIEQSWNPLDTPLTEQKPLEITKQKPDREKSIKNRNAERKFNKK